MPSNTLADLADEHLVAAVAAKAVTAVELLRQIAAGFNPVAFANSLGAEDMVLTDMIVREVSQIESFTLDTGRLPGETYDLIETARRFYGSSLRLKIYYPRHDRIEAYVNHHGVNAFRDSVEMRKTCCHIRKVEPLQRALSGKAAWITGLRSAQAATRGGVPTRQFDAANGLEKFNPLADWTEREVWMYIRANRVPYNRLHDRHYPSIGCAPCTRPIAAGEDIRAGRWWWESPATKECGLHASQT